MVIRQTSKHQHDLASSLVGIGLYTIPEASRLTRISRGRIRRWLAGYSRTVAGRTTEYPALWRRDLPEIEGHVALSFLDLMEVRYVSWFRDREVKWTTIKRIADKLRSRFRTDHPFCTGKFATDGIRIFSDDKELIGNDSALMDLATDQLVFEELIKEGVEKTVEFAALQARRWWPLGIGRHIVLDPRRSFGQPIIHREGIPTIILADAYRAEQSAKVVAAWFNASIEAVNDAVDYETQLEVAKHAA